MRAPLPYALTLAIQQPEGGAVGADAEGEERPQAIAEIELDCTPEAGEDYYEHAPPARAEEWVSKTEEVAHCCQGLDVHLPHMNADGCC